jgi:hypothetical protein
LQSMGQEISREELDSCRSLMSTRAKYACSVKKPSRAARPVTDASTKLFVNAQPWSFLGVTFAKCRYDRALRICMKCAGGIISFVCLRAHQRGAAERVDRAANKICAVR